MDYDQKSEGGAGHLVRLIKSFAAAGIVNRVVAVFDNDCAASEALMSLDKTRLPENIRVVQYPDIPLGESYPTLGPASKSSERPNIVLAQVNGRAASIELYLGRDVLSVDGTNFAPVQWESYKQKVGSYQGVVTQKDVLQKRFNKKAKEAEADRAIIHEQDWEGLRVILEEIKKPFL